MEEESFNPLPLTRIRRPLSNLVCGRLSTSASLSSKCRPPVFIKDLLLIFQLHYIYQLLAEECKPTLTWEDSPYVADTTLFKAVPHTRIPLDAEITDSIQSLETDLPLKEYFEYDYRQRELLDIAGIDRGPLPIQSGPILHVKSISISNYKQHWDDHFQMFGQISIMDHKKNTFYLFSTGPDESHQDSSKLDLFLFHCPMAPVMGGKLKFSLRNPQGTPQIFTEDKEFSLDYSSRDNCEQDMYQEFLLEGGYYAKVVFNKIPFAALVHCIMSLRYTPPGCKDGFYKVRGSVTINNIVCVDSSRDIQMKYGEYSGFGQSMVVFAVPAGLPLKVEYKLHHDDFEFANGTYEVPPFYAQSPEDPIVEHLPCKDENYCLVIHLHWILHEDFFAQHGPWDAYSNVKWRIITPKKHRWGPRFVQFSEGDLVEVFSVFLGGGDSVPNALCGRIVVRGACGKFYIFARNKDCPDKYSSSKHQHSPSKRNKIKQQNYQKTLSLTWPDKWFVEKDFYMHLRLKDADENPVCKGYLSWVFGNTRFDRRLCDVIEGEKGCFAAVHYSVFKNAKKAKVSVKCNKEDGYSLVYGRVSAAYDNDDAYPSTYDEECYRSIIFKRSKEDCVTVNNSFEIPLSKSHVAAPSDCEKLIVDADMWVCSCKASSFQRASAKLHFKASRSGSESKQLGSFLVTVNWSQ